MKLKLHVALTMTLLLFTQLIFAQSKTVTGTVTASDTKESLPGVSVVLEGTTKGTVTDLDGKYSIEVDEIRYDIITGYSKNRDSRLHLPIGRTGGYESDGKLAVVEFKDEEPVFAYLYDGSYLMYKGQKLIGEKDFGNYEKVL